MAKEVKLTGVLAGKMLPAAGRPQRVATLLVLLTVLSYFDLAFTQSQSCRPRFVEGNAVAAVVADGPMSRAIYKLGTFGVGAVILYLCRRHWQAEFATWGLTLCFAGLMVWWVIYMDTVEVFLADPLAPAHDLGAAVVDTGPRGVAALLGAG